MKKVAVVILAMALLMLGVLAVPVIAVSPKKLDATADTLTGNPLWYFNVRDSPGKPFFPFLLWTSIMKLTSEGKTCPATSSAGGPSVLRLSHFES